jgi:hypothetical protein
MGDMGARPDAGCVPVGTDFPFVLSSSGFFPNFQKSRFRGLAAGSSAADSVARVAVDPLWSKGAEESLDSVLGALIRSLTERSLGDMVANDGEDRRGMYGCGLRRGSWTSCRFEGTCERERL